MVISPPPVQQQPVKVPGYPVVGNLPEFARDPIRFITRLREEFGDVAAFSLMGTRSVLISDPYDIERVLLETGKRYSNGKQDVQLAIRTVLGNGLVRSEGDFWKRQRKLMAPAFHHQNIKQYADLIVNCTEDLASRWQSDTTRDVHQDMMELTQRIIMLALFEVDVRDNAGVASRAFDAMMQAIGSEMKGPEAVLPEFIPTPSRKRLKEGVATINGMLMDIIAQRRADPTPRHDLLAWLMDARDDEGLPMTDEQLLDEIRTLYLAGHETTATTLSWTWVLLASNPDAYAKLEAEVDSVLHGQRPTADDVQNLPYTNALIKEVLRLYPVAWITRRVALEDVEIGGYLVANGTSVFLSPWVVHHDARWYDEPEAFRPERWLKEKSELPPREAYIPFGGGPRICIGNGLALMEAALILATLVQRDHVALLPDHPVVPELAGTLRPRSGLMASITPRT
ncbi:MAG: cytochrome P450 [Anaerolineae bacterium]